MALSKTWTTVTPISRTIALILFIALPFVGFILGVDYQMNQDVSKLVSVSAPKPAPTATPLPDNTIKFDVEKVKVGDKIGAMTITKISGFKSEKPINGYADISFTGKISVNGEILYIGPNSPSGESVCMQNLDAASLAKMPKIISDSTNNVFFCFNNLDAAKKNLNSQIKNKQRATVVINNFHIPYIPIDTYATADLISIEQTSN